MIHVLCDDDVFLIISSLCVCVFSESSLTSKNLSTVLDIMEDMLWEVFGLFVNIPPSELNRIKSQYSSDRKCKHAFIDLFISKHPAPSWTLVAHTLYEIGGRWYDGDGVSCLKSLDLLQQLFPTGIYNIHIVHTSLCVYYTQCICTSN